MKRSLALSVVVVFAVGVAGFSQTVFIENVTKQINAHPRQDTIMVNLLNLMSEQFQPVDFDSSLHYADRALQLAESLSYNKGIATAIYRKAYSYWFLGSSELSIEKTLESIRIAEREHDVIRQAECYQLLALNYRDQRLPDQAEKHIHKAEALSQSIANWELLVKSYNIAGVIVYTRYSADSARVLYERALAIALEHNTPKFYLANVLSNLGDTYINSDFEKGFKYFHEALQVSRDTKNRSAEAGVLYDMGSALMLKERFEEANEYLMASLSVANDLRLKRVTRLAYRELAALKSRERKFDEANKYLDSYIAVHDSLLNTAKTRQIVALEKEHEADQREQTIKILEQERYIQSIWNTVLIAGSILLAILIVVIYRLQTLRNHKARQLLEAQTALNLKLKETDQFKSRFFANISHEFRTPLTLILGPIEEKLESANSDKQDLILMKRNANRLLSLVNQLLDLSKLEAGKMEVNMRSGDLKEFVTMLSASFDSLAERKGIYFSKSIVLPQYNYGFDEDKIEKIMSNILSNAFKFTATGGAVTLTVCESLDSSAMMIKLTDTGKGIPQEDLQQVFSPFYQSRNTSDDGNVGTGLGLALVYELVKVYGGTIDIQSQVNVSTTLNISLPIPLSGEPLPKSEPRPVRYGTVDTPIATPLGQETGAETLLIVDDSPDLRLFMANSFKGRFNIILARDGEEALKAAGEHIPDLVISDVMMPGMDGIQLTKFLKTNEKTSHIPVILLTAKNDFDSRIDGLTTGADDYLAKPFSMHELRVRVDNLIAIRKKLAARNLEAIVKAPVASPPPSLDDKFMSKLRACIETNLANTNFGVEMLATEMCLSRAQLFRKVKAMTNISPSELINDIRLQHAAIMIQSKADTLAQIGYSVGFNEQSYFAKRFRKKFGMSPSDYSNR